MCELARACTCFLGSPVVLWNHPRCAASSDVCYFLGRSLPFLTAMVCTHMANIPLEVHSRRALWDAAVGRCCGHLGGGGVSRTMGVS